jgi:hypothetical protein
LCFVTEVVGVFVPRFRATAGVRDGNTALVDARQATDAILAGHAHAALSCRPQQYAPATAPIVVATDIAAAELAHHACRTVAKRPNRPVFSYRSALWICKPLMTA